MKRLFFAFVAIICYVIQPVYADTLWTCTPDRKNPSTKMLLLSVSDDKLGVFDVGGQEILVAPFSKYHTTEQDGLIIQARLHQEGVIMYSFSIAMNTARTAGKVMFGLTTDDSTVFWDCK